MLNLLLSQGTDGLSFALQFGSQNAVLGFVWWPFPALLLGCVAMCCFAGMSAGRGPRGYDPRGGYRRGPSRFWAILFAVAAVVLVSRGMKEHVHTTTVVDPDNRPVAAVAFERRRERLDEAVSRLERQLDRASDQVDRALAHGSAQLDRQVDHGTDQMSRQLDKGAADMAQQLEHAAAQLIREIEHLGHQVAQRHHDVPAARSITVSTPTTEAAVTEPNAPALPVAGAPQVDVVVAVPSAPPSSPPAAQAQPAPPAVPAAPSAAPVAVAAPHAAPAASPSADVAGEKLPDWAKTDIVDESNRKLVVVQGGFAGTQSEAEHDTLEAARLVLGDAIQRAYPKVGKWLPPAESVREVAVRLTYVEKIPRKTLSSGTPFIVYRAYKQVELSPAVYSQLLSSWKEEVVPRRLEALAGFAALLTLTFATGAAYFRLDDRTQGRYRGRLKVAAVAVIGAGVAAAAALI